MKLDETKPYGQVYGHPRACFEQFGVLYDAAKNAIDEKRPVLTVPPKKKEAHGLES